MLETCYQYERIEAGCDEAGRGCLAGAVFAAAVILPPDFHDPLLNDSKQMSERNRDRLRPIIEREAVAWAVAAVPPERIDEINILNASFEGMCRAVGELRTRPEFLAIDGNRFRSSLDIPYRCIVKGDGNTGSFRPNDEVSRSEFAAIMMRYAQKAGDDTVVEDGALDGYADADQVPAWFENEVAWAVEAGIMGVGTDVINPNGEITRAEVAAMAIRL